MIHLNHDLTFARIASWWSNFFCVIGSMEFDSDEMINRYYFFYSLLLNSNLSQWQTNACHLVLLNLVNNSKFRSIQSATFLEESHYLAFVTQFIIQFVKGDSMLFFLVLHWKMTLQLGELGYETIFGMSTDFVRNSIE